MTSVTGQKSQNHLHNASTHGHIVHPAVMMQIRENLNMEIWSRIQKLPQQRRNLVEPINQKDINEVEFSEDPRFLFLQEDKLAIVQRHMEEIHRGRRLQL